MSGGTLEHNDIICNLVTALRTSLRGTPCKAYCQDLRLWVEHYQLFTYPDILVVCGPPQLLPGRRDTVTDATLIIEVLSRSTRDYDAGDKFKFYRALKSFKEYLLVSQDEFRVEHHSRQEPNQWLMTEHTAEEAELDLTSVGLKLSLRSIYDMVGISDP